MTNYNYLVQELINETMEAIEDYESKLDDAKKNKKTMPELPFEFRAFVTVCDCCKSAELNLDAIGTYATSTVEAMKNDPHYLVKNFAFALTHIIDETDHHDKAWISKLIETQYDKIVYSPCSVSAHKKLVELFFKFPETFKKRIEGIEESWGNQFNLASFFK